MRADGLQRSDHWGEGEGEGKGEGDRVREDELVEGDGDRKDDDGLAIMDVSKTRHSLLGMCVTMCRLHAFRRQLCYAGHCDAVQWTVGTQLLRNPLCGT